MLSPISVWITNGALLSWRIAKRLMMTFLDPVRFRKWKWLVEHESSFEGSLLVSEAFDVLILRYGLWRVLLMFTSIWCDGSRPDLLYALELVTRSYGKISCKTLVRKFCVPENVSLSRKRQDESKVAQRWCCATLLFEIVWWASITCGYLYYGLGDYSRNIVWCMYDNDKQYAS